MQTNLKYLFFFCALLVCQATQAQNTTKDEDAFFIRKIYDKALTESKAYSFLTYLSTKIGARLGSSPQAAAAVEYTRQMLDSIGVDSVWLQPCMVSHWVRGDKEIVRVNSKTLGTIDLPALSLGNTVGTGASGLMAQVIEVKSLDDLDKLGKEKIAGKIVFFNRPMEPTQINTFAAYSGAVDQRGAGPSRASKYGAIAAIVRSMTTRLDDVPHTGVTVFSEGVNLIPAVAISTNAAEQLSQLLKNESLVQVYVRTTCQILPPKLSYNVIGEWRGSVFPKDILLVGAHLDSWDVGQGAHDDGAGVVQAMDVIHLLRAANYRPKHTIRAVLFMNEESGKAGSEAYLAESNRKKEFHLAAIESDRGGFAPRGFTLESEESLFVSYFRKISSWSNLLEPYGLTFKKGGSGADIAPLKIQKGILIGFEPDSQRYFDYHHTAIDTIDAVNKRELELGSAAMASLIYLIDKYGL